MSTPKAGIVGTGFMAMAHAEGLRRAGVDIGGIAGSSSEKAMAAAQRLGAGRPYDSYESLLEDDTISAVHITTPNDLHFPMAKAALQAGKHVLCEKPLAMTSAQSAELVALAEQSERITAVNYNLRFYPLNLHARSQVAGGALGPIHSLVGRYVQDWLLEETDYNWRVRSDVGGPLRAIADIGTHWLDLVQMITGLQVEAVCADLSTVIPVRRKPRGEVETFSSKLSTEQATEDVAIDTEDQGAVMLRFSGGARGLLWVSQMTAGRKNHLEYEISGRGSALAWNSEAPETLWLGHRNRANETLMRDPALLAAPARAHAAYPGGHAEGYADTFKQCFRAFYGRIEGHGSGTTPDALASFADGHRELLLCDAILKSHESESWVTVGA